MFTIQGADSHREKEILAPRKNQEDSIKRAVDQARITPALNCFATEAVANSSPFWKATQRKEGGARVRPRQLVDDTEDDTEIDEPSAQRPVAHEVETGVGAGPQALLT